MDSNCITRRDFVARLAIFGGAMVFSPARLLLERILLGSQLSAANFTDTRITILHTNDTHSQIDPLPSNDSVYPGKGGVARRATLVKRVRKENPNTLLIDAGDVCQGTPYFNFYKGEVEYRAMSQIGYDAGTLGNHEFDNGVESLAAALKFANFDLGISPVALITPDNFEGITYLDPVIASRQIVSTLRETERCALVVCMSHLGYYPEPKSGEIGDSQVATQVDGIDFIASGHTHTFMDKPVIVKQPSGNDTLIFQVGKSGIYVGRVDFTFRAGKLVSAVGRLLDLRDPTLARIPHAVGVDL